MRKLILGMLSAGVIAVLALALGAQPAKDADARPDVARMTMDQLLEEFHHPSPKEMSCPAPQMWIDLINALRRQGEPLVTRLRADLKSTDAKVKIAAEQVLLNLGNVSRPAVPELVVATSDADDEVRWWAVAALGNLKDPRAFYALVNAARDAASRVRVSVQMRAAASLADARFALAVLALADADKSVRFAAIQQLGFLNDRRAAAYLVSLLDDVEARNYNIVEGVKTASRNCDDAARTLEMIVNKTWVSPMKGTQEEHDALVKKWKDWWKENGAEFDAKLYVEPELKRSLE